MSSVTVILWLLLILIGTPMLIAGISLRVHALLNRDYDALEMVEFRSISFEGFPWFVRLLLRGYRQEALEAGFEELACFSRPNLADPNFTCVLVSTDRTTIVQVEYARVSLLFMFLAIFVKPAFCLRSLVGIHGSTMESVFDGDHRLITTRHAFLAADHEPGKKEFNVVPPRTTFEQKYAAHREKAEALCTAENLRPKTFHTTEEFYSFEQACLRKLANKSRSEMDEALEGSEGL